MARHAKLNWDSTRDCWRVVYRGKKLRFDGGTGRADRVARRDADDKFRKIRAELDHEAELAKPHRARYIELIDEWEGVLAWSMEHGDDERADRARTKLLDLKKRLAQAKPPAPSRGDEHLPDPIVPTPVNSDGVPLTSMLEDPKQLTQHVPWNEMDPHEGPCHQTPEQDVWSARINDTQRRRGHALFEETLGGCVDRFLKAKRREVKAGQLSVGRADTLRIHLDHARQILSDAMPVDRISGQTLNSLREELLKMIATRERFSESYASDILSSFRTFLRWLAELGTIEALPANIDSRRLAIRVSHESPKSLRMSHVHKLLKEASPRSRLYLLLGLNCAMTQQDISDLHPNEVNWRAGTITRKRSKTRWHKNVPEVTYKLWPVTLKLLKEMGRRRGDHVLLNTAGRPLKSVWFRDDDKATKSDAVYNAMKRLAKKTKVSFTLKSLKKTAATLLRDQPRFRGVYELYLDHAPATTADRHYAGPPQRLLGVALKWLEKKLVPADLDDAV